MFPLGIFGGLAAGVVGGLITTAVILDLIAWWPVWLGVLGLAILLRRSAARSVRTGGVTALLLALAAAAFLAGHLAGWTVMPSAGGRLVGPVPDGVEAASLTAVIHGRVDVGSGSDFLYQVLPIRWGGQYGLPRAFEEVPNTETINVDLALVDHPGLSSFAGWDILLSDQPIWSLDLAGVLAADLSGLDILSLVVGGSGNVKLGDSDFVRMIEVSGVFQIEFPRGVAVTVVGEASVPDDWLSTEDGWASPSGGDAWVVTVLPGSSVTVVTP